MRKFFSAMIIGIMASAFAGAAVAETASEPVGAAAVSNKTDTVPAKKPSKPKSGTTHRSKKNKTTRKEDLKK